MDLSVSDGDKEALTIELINKDTKNILITIYIVNIIFR